MTRTKAAICVGLGSLGVVGAVGVLRAFRAQADRDAEADRVAHACKRVALGMRKDFALAALPRPPDAAFKGERNGLPVTVFFWHAVGSTASTSPEIDVDEEGVVVVVECEDGHAFVDLRYAGPASFRRDRRGVPIPAKS
jgi:hypothetical protein